MAYRLERELIRRGLRPRLCYLTKGPRGYGFHLHGERNRGAQFIRKIEPGSPADLAGLRSGDRVVEVNGENVEHAPHYQVVQKIMAVDHRTRLLVVDRATDDLLHFHGLPCTEDLAVEMGCLSPRASSLASSPVTSCSSSPHMSSSPFSPWDSVTLPFFRDSGNKPRRPSVTAEMDSLYTVVNSNKSPAIFPRGGRNSLMSLPDHDLPPPLSDRQPECQADLSGPHPGVQIPAGPAEDAQSTEATRAEVAPDLRPRLCCIAMGKHGYGFNLHSDKRRAGHFVRLVDPGSPAERAGLQTGDRVVEVNSRSIEGMRHSQVVAIIRGGGNQTQLLVVDPETDALFKRLGIMPTAAHLTEDCVDGPLMENSVSNYPVLQDSSASPSPMPDPSPVSLPTLNVTLTDRPITNGSLKHQSRRSSFSNSILSEMSMEMFSSGYNKRHSAPAGRDEVKAQRVADPAWEYGLYLSPTAAEARQKARAKRGNKRAPPMDWSKKHEIFSNF
ncbi:Na(+)/H(+) exchange regulatory cofactor NHE-RF2 [Electrophorus electricus]|nr:Na(+)/H(+) exchange regulatory cofactor NHE-RF2 [Electrophorus electricus]